MKLLFVSLGFCLAMAAHGQEFDELKSRKLDSLFTALKDNRMSMGSISIYRDGKEVYARTWGFSNVVNRQEMPATKEKTLYRIGSLSKVFTAWLVMKEVEAGRLGLQQTIDLYFPNLQGPNASTVEQLLLHRSRLPVFHKVDDLEKLRKTKTEAELVAMVNKREPNTDTAAKYNNLNYILLGLIIERLEHKKYNEVLAEKMVTIPGARIYGTDSFLNYARNEANSFHMEKETWEEDYENSSWGLSDGSGFLLSDAKTLNEFMYRLFNNQLLGREYVDQMLPKQSMFGYGLMKANYGKHKGYGHSGRIEGFTSATTYFPAEKWGVTLLQNGTVYPLNDIMIQVGGILFDEALPLPNLQKMTLTAAEQQKMMGVYENEEEGYKVIVDSHKGELRLRVARGSGLFNKMILSVYALERDRLFNPLQGIIFDFSKPGNGVYALCEMRVNGARLPMKRVGKE